MLYKAELVYKGSDKIVSHTGTLDAVSRLLSTSTTVGLESVTIKPYVVKTVCLWGDKLVIKDHNDISVPRKVSPSILMTAYTNGSYCLLEDMVEFLDSTGWLIREASPLALEKAAEVKRLLKSSFARKG